MPRRRKPRPYDSSRRIAGARETRAAILAAAHRQFVANGWGGTTMAAVARAAGVALDTVYASVGRKPELVRRLVERAISGADDPIPAEHREYVRAIHAEPMAARKLALYAAAVRAIHARLAPIVRVIQAAAPTEAALGRMWKEISERRADNMRRFTAELAATGALRPDLSVEEAADVVWATGAPELYLLLVGDRGWAPKRYERWLSSTWDRLLLTPPGGRDTLLRGRHGA